MKSPFLVETKPRKSSARTPEQHNELARDFVLQNMPRWLLHEEVVNKLRLKEIRFDNRLNARGMASARGIVWLNPSSVTKFRHVSPYSSPFGKSDMSPLGVLVHEIGHMLWFATFRHLDSQEWKRIYTEQRKQAVTSYARVHPDEDFAESFRLWALNPKLLKELSPERHRFITLVWQGLMGFPPRTYRQSKDSFLAMWHSLYLNLSTPHQHEHSL